MARLIYGCVAGLLALWLQLLVLNTFLQYPEPGGPIFDLFVLQLLAALAYALFVSAALPTHYRHGRNWAFIMAFAVCFFLPVTGQIWLLSLLLIEGAYPMRRPRVDTALIGPPQFVSDLMARVTYGFGARLRPRLRNRNSATGDRLAAMVAMRTMPAHVTAGLLQELLADPVEEIRLLAYGIADNAENGIAQRIHAAQRQLSDAPDDALRGMLNSSLAELHWELVYQNLVSGEVRRHTLARVEDYAHESLALGAAQGRMWYLLARCALLKKEGERAEQLLDQAEAAHFPACRLTAWKAEAAFRRRDYARIARLMEPIKQETAIPALRPTIRYWW